MGFNSGFKGLKTIKVKSKEIKELATFPVFP